MTVEAQYVQPGDAGKLECVDRFCYLDDMLCSGGRVEEASRIRVKCALGKFRELALMLTSRGASEKLFGNIYMTCAHSMIVYGSEVWALKVCNVQRLERTEMMLVNWICGVTLNRRRSSQELLDRLGIVCVADVVRRGTLRWLGNVERKRAEDWVSKCRNLIVDGARGKGRGRKTWNNFVVEDLNKLSTFSILCIFPLQL
jgi:hypothetical protein